MSDCLKQTVYTDVRKLPSQKTNWTSNVTLLHFTLIDIHGRADYPKAAHTERTLLKKLGLLCGIQEKIIQQAMFVCVCVLLSTMFCLFHCLLALPPKLVKEGNLKISTSRYWSTKLLLVLSPLLPCLNGHSVSVMLWLHHSRAWILIWKMDPALAAADARLHWLNTGNRGKPADGIFKATVNPFVAMKKTSPVLRALYCKKLKNIH